MLSNDLRQLEMWSDLWSVTFNAAKLKFVPLQIIHLFILHYDSATKH